MTKQKLGLPLKVWNAAKAEIRIALIECAKNRKMITYGELVKQVTTTQLEAHDIRLNHMLGELSAEESEAGNGMISALVVHKLGDMEPGPGFFELAEELGYEVDDHTEFWVDQIKHIYRAWMP